MATQQHIGISERAGVLIITVLADQLTEDAQVNEWKDQMIDEIQRRSPHAVIIDMQNVEYLTQSENAVRIRKGTGSVLDLGLNRWKS